MGAHSRGRALRAPALLVVPTLLSVCSFAEAADFWRQKPVVEWTRKETERFFRESPWVHRISVRGGPSLAALAQAAEPIPEARRQDIACDACSRKGAEGIPGAWSTSPGLSSASWSWEFVFYVQWTSARVVREAIAHLRALDGVGNEQPSPPPLPNYLVVIGGPDFRAFEGLTESALAMSARLRAKQAGTEVRPSRVTIRRQQNGRIASVHLEFPRETNGRPSVLEEERQIEFTCKVGDLILKTSFEPPKMTTLSGRDV